MSGQTERAHTTRELRLSRRRRPSSLDEATAHHRDLAIQRHQIKEAQWNDVARRIIKEVSDTPGETPTQVSPQELLSVIDYIRLMKSSVEIFQTINQALKDRIDELMQISERDGQILQSVLNYVESLPVMNAVRDERTNELAFHVRFHSSRSIHVRASDAERRCQGGGRKTRANWLRGALSAAVCLLVGTSVVKSRVCKRNNA